jgi:tetratricopeptide (TPR) repeat protein
MPPGIARNHHAKISDCCLVAFSLTNLVLPSITPEQVLMSLSLSRRLFVFVVSALTLINLGCPSQQDRSNQTAALVATYVGHSACVDCHKRESGLWAESDHARAMAEPDDSTVLGDFNNAMFTHHGITSHFTRNGGGFFVRTEGEDGKLHDYRISYVFGYFPLQQYLVEFPGGKYQTLPLCWDARPKQQGGQRWFHIYGDERIPPNDILFWTRVTQNWNYMCAECHSTNLLKNYDGERQSFATSWTDINVACEACHGPGSEHVAWANASAGGHNAGPDAAMGLTVRLKDPDRGSWTMDMKTGNSVRTTPLMSDVLLETCARCHSRRAQIREPYAPGQPLLTTHLPSFLEDQLYFADGQIRDEVYEYASFKQSKMYGRGVTCIECHEPHSMKVYARDNTLCYRCHLAEKFGARSHHFHDPDSTGASCIDCHMPTRTYMRVDVRRDHSFRIPRPVLAGEVGAPDVCTACHAGKSLRWASDYVRKWYGAKAADTVHYGRVLHAGRIGRPDAPDLLARLAADRSIPTVVRGTALSMLGRYPGKSAEDAIERGLFDKDPMIRLGAAGALSVFPPVERFLKARHLLADDLLAIRIEATGSLLDVPATSLPADSREVMSKALREYRTVQLYNGDQPSAHMNLGNLALGQGDYAMAEAEFRKAIAIEPAFMLSYVNLADLYRVRGEDPKGEQVLKEALDMNPDFPDGRYALGLLLVRQKRVTEGLNHLKRAAALRPEEPRFAYAYGVGLYSAGDAAGAVSVLENSLSAHPYSSDLLLALTAIYRDRGEREEALRHAETLLRFWPRDPAYARLYQELAITDKP